MGHDVEDMVIRETLGAMLQAAASKVLPQGWIFLPEGTLTVSSNAVLIPHESYEDEVELAATAEKMGFPVEGLETTDLEDVCQGVLRLSCKPDVNAYLRAFLYYLKFDAFLPNLDAGDPPSRDEVLLTLDRTFFESLGEEQADCRCRRENCTRGVVKMSAFCRVHHFESVRGRPCPFEKV